MLRSIALILLFASVAGVCEQTHADESVRRVLTQVGADEYEYIVGPRAPSLSAVARELYADRRMARKIAEWNGLSPEAWLKVGDRLRIKKRPRLSADEGTDLLIRYWHIAGRKDLVVRLKALRGGAQSPSHAPTAKAEVPSHLGGWLPGFGPGAQASSPPPSAVGHTRSASKARQQQQEQGAPEHHSVMTSTPSSAGVRRPARGQAPAAAAQIVEVDEPTAFEQKVRFLKREPTAEELEEMKREPKNNSYWLGNHADDLIRTIRTKLGNERQGENPAAAAPDSPSPFTK
jgi:hypothetical protein